MIKRDTSPIQLGILDGSLQPSEMADLKKRLLTDPDAMNAYLDFIELEGLLHAKYSHSTNIARPMPRLMDDVVKRQRKRQVKISIFAAAALIVVLLIATALLRAPEPPQAICQFSPDHAFVMIHADGKQSTDGKMLPGSTMQLKKGTAELLLDSGVKSVVEAPAEFTLTDEGHLDFTHGKAWFHVPLAGKGFTVSTPRMRVVDLGTEFAIHSPKKGRASLHVFTGKVELSASHGSGEKLPVSAGSAYSVDAQSKVHSIPLDSDLFYRSLPDFTGTLDLDPSREGGLGVQINTTPKLIANRDHKAADNHWGVNWEGQQLQVTSRRIWVSRQDLGEKAPTLTTTISGLKPNQHYEISIRHPMHHTHPLGPVRAAIEGAPLKEYNQHNSELLVTSEENSEFSDYRSILGTPQADSTGTIRIRISPTTRKDSRSYYSAVGIREIHTE
ncbi:hypothetical protein NT6N_37700 [Oceaniferula spumae]|uniref:FecR protein domain-containing protein n=1 Tax=Oceaniferula spumae TaxID=2979115 RepID=A0AAT9FRT0_9BACT